MCRDEGCGRRPHASSPRTRVSPKPSLVLETVTTLWRACAGEAQ